MAGIVHRADGGGFREAVDLQHRNAEHHEKKLCFDRQRRRAADQRLQVRADALANRRETSATVASREPNRIAEFGLFCCRLPNKRARARAKTLSAANPPRF